MRRCINDTILKINNDIHSHSEQKDSDDINREKRNREKK